MAFVTDFTCRTCEQPRNEVVDGSGICHECRHKAATKKRRMHLAALEAHHVRY